MPSVRGTRPAGRRSEAGVACGDDCLVSVGDLQLGEDRRDVVSDGFLGEDEASCDGSVVEPMRDQIEHFPLAPGELREGRICYGLGACEEGDDLVGAPRPEDCFAAGDGGHGRPNGVFVCVLEQVTARPRAERREDGAGVVAHREHEDAGVGIGRADALRRFDASAQASKVLLRDIRGRRHLDRICWFATVGAPCGGGSRCSRGGA